jgi:hypothetical protein
LTADIVGRWQFICDRRPVFRLPLRDVVLIASIEDIGQYIATNESAQQLLSALRSECDRRKLPDYPTVMMLRAALDYFGLPWTAVPYEALGIPGVVLPMTKGGSS